MAGLRATSRENILNGQATARGSSDEGVLFSDNQSMRSSPTRLQLLPARISALCARRRWVGRRRRAPISAADVTNDISYELIQKSPPARCSANCQESDPKIAELRDSPLPHSWEDLDEIYRSDALTGEHATGMHRLLRRQRAHLEEQPTSEEGFDLNEEPPSTEEASPMSSMRTSA